MDDEMFKPGDWLVGNLVWFEPGIGFPLPGEVLEVHEAAQITVIRTSIDGKQQTFTLAKDEGNLQVRESSEIDGVDDLTLLKKLHEASILWNLRSRFMATKFYTFIGSILVSINPYSLYSNLYGLEMAKKYAGASIGQLPPHIFAVGQAAYSAIVNQKQSQAIIVAGESGSGKTEGNKLIVRYLTAIASTGINQNKITEQILESNSLLESFGNARTLKNDNSSRFGKYLEVYFKSGVIIGAKVTHYLLEKSRIVTQYQDERNYHIFYELLSGLSETERIKFGLLQADKYFYLNQGSSDCAPNGSCKEWASLKGAMQVLGLTEGERDGIISILASILHLGNVYFHRKQLQRGVEGVELGSEGAECKWMAHLLEISSEDLIQSLKIRTTETRNDVLCTPLTIDQALDARDALAKTLYSGLFNWLVSRLNSIIHKGGTHDAQRISILDIYGFESLQENSFEQLCINYANESLQLYFNKNVFKMEQTEYSKERLEWTNLEWEDNLPIIHLLAKKPVGIFHLLDDESNFPRASDISFLEKCHYNHALNEIYKRPRIGANEFGIHHFGNGLVWYNVDGFLEKNRDAVRPEVLALLESSSLKIVQDISKQLRALRDGKSHPRSPNATTRFVTIKPRLSTASARFSDSLQHLLTSISKCSPWFVRCIKPNHDKQAKKIDMPCVLDQIRFLRVLSTVEIRQKGYPVRLRFQHFVERYRHLLRNTPRGTPYRDLCKNILSTQTPDQSQNYQIGATRIFLREILHRKLEDGRYDRLHRAATVIQKKVRKVLLQRKLQRQEDSAVILQKVFRGYKERKRFYELKKGVVTAQALYRGKKTRSEYQKIKHDNALRESQAEMIHQSQKVTGFESRRLINASSLDVPAELAFIFSKMEGWEQKHSDKHLVKVVGTVPGPPFSSDLPSDLDQFTFSKFCSVYCDGLQLYFRREPISKPFLNRTASKDKDFHDSIMIFKLILRWMGDLSLDASKDKILADYIVHKGLSSKNLRDEIFVQISNQLHGVDESQASRLWLLMSHCLSSFQPGAALSKYLMKFVKDNAPEAQNEILLKKLLRGNNRVSRMYPPTYLEWRASKQSDIALRMTLPDGSLKTIAIDSWTTCEEAATLSLSMIPKISKGWTVVLDGNDIEATNETLTGLDYVLDLIGEKEVCQSFPTQGNNSRKILPEIQHNTPKLFKSNGVYKEVEPLKRPLTKPPAPPQQSKTNSEDGYIDHVTIDHTKVRRKASIDMLSRNSALNERYFEYEKGRSKSMDDLKNSNSESEHVPEVQVATPLNEMGLSESRLNDRYHSVEQNIPIKQSVPRLQKLYAGKRLGSVNSYRTDRSEILVRSSALSDTSETPSLASHVRRVRVPSQASDVDQFLDDLFSPVLDGNLDELSDARSLAASIRGNQSLLLPVGTVLSKEIEILQNPRHLCKMIKGGGNNEIIENKTQDESLEEYINELFKPIFMNENVRILAQQQDLACTIKGGDDEILEAGTYQQHVQRAFLESAMEQNIKIQQQLVAQNEALQTLLGQQSPEGKTNVQNATSPFEARKPQNGTKSVFNFSGIEVIERKEPGENHSLFSSPPVPPPMPPALEESDPFQRPFMDPYGRAKTVRIGKWRWPPPDNVDGGSNDFIAFKIRQNQRKTTPQSQFQNGSNNQDHHHQDEWDKYQSIETVEKTREKNKSDSALNKIAAVSKTQKRSFDLGAERPGPSIVGKLKLSTEMRQRLEKVTAGHSVRSTKSDTVSEIQPIKLDESRKLMLEQQLRGNLSVRTQIQKMEASRIQKPFGPLPSIPPPPNSIPPAPPMQQHSKENVPSFLSRMERDTFGVKDNYNDSQEKIEVEQLEIVYEVNRRSRSHSRERENYDESLWDRSEVEGPPSNEEAYKSNIRDKSRKIEISQIERERESLLVYQPKFSEKTKKNSQSDQATFKNHMFSQKEHEKKLSTLSQTPRENFEEMKESVEGFAVNSIPKPVLAPALLKAPSACLTYGTKFPWKLRVKKEVFRPAEIIDSPIAINFIFAQIIADLLGTSQRISSLEKKQAFGFFKSHDIDLDNCHVTQIRNVTKCQLIEISRTWPLYFSRLFAVNNSPQYPDVSFLAVNHSGGYLARKDNRSFVVVKQLPFDELTNIIVLPRPAALQLSLRNGERCVLHVSNATAVHSFLHSFLNEHKKLKSIANGNGKNVLTASMNNVAEAYKMSDIILEKDAPISKNVKPAAIVSHQHQESIVYSKEQTSPTQTSVVKHSLLQFALQHFRYDITEESNKNRPEKRSSHDRSHAANLVKWQGSILETPLLKLPMDLNNLALECFECILRYSGDLPPDVNCSEVKCVYTVLMHCHKHLILRDEVYCQLMKQTTANRSSFPDSAARAWRLLSILAAYFGCSESLKPYLVEHLTSATTDRKGTAAAVCLTNLRKTARCGGRKNVPSVEEVTAVSAGRSARRQIYRLPGGAERVVNTRCSTVVSDVISELCSLLGVENEAEQQEFSLYCIVQGDAFTMPLCSDEYILDVTTELLKTNQPFYLIFCRSIWHFPLKKNPPPTPLYIEVLFNQVAPDYLEGLLLEIPNTGTPSLDYIRDISRIAAILHRAADLNHIPVMKEIKFLLPKPALGLRELKPAQWVNLVQTEFMKVLVLTPLQCKAEFLNVLSAWPLFGSSFFAVKRVYGDDIGGIPEDDNGVIARELILALNRRGVLFLDSNTHETLHHWHFIEIISTRKVRSEEALYLDMKVGNLLQQNVIRVQTEQAHEISRIIRQYISMAALKDE